MFCQCALIAKIRHDEASKAVTRWIEQGDASDDRMPVGRVHENAQQLETQTPARLQSDTAVTGDLASEPPVDADGDRRGRASVEVHPGVLSGTPCLSGTRLPVYLIADVVRVDGVDAAMGLWGLPRAQVLVACWFAGVYGTLHPWDTQDDIQAPLPRTYRVDLVDHAWLDLWRDWAQQNAGALWQSHYDDVQDPPRRDRA